MAKIESITITTARKVVANYCTREVGFTVTVTPAEGENAREVTQRWTRGLQDLCDQELGDAGQPESFRGSRPNA